MDSRLVEVLAKKYDLLRPSLNEMARRHWAASEAMILGWGGVTSVAAATGLSRTTIRAGIAELRAGHQKPDADELAGRVRRSGGGRHRVAEDDRALLGSLEALVEPTSRGDPMSPLRWTCRSTRNLADELCRQGHRVSYRTVAMLLDGLGYSLQANRKTREGTSHPDRNAQFEYINKRVRLFQRQGQPVVSVDTKKKELVGDFKNVGREYRPQKSPEKVRVHDFRDKELGKVVPYGVYDLAANVGWVSVGINHDTSEFAAETLRRWWLRMGSSVYPLAKRLLLTADSGGSNGSRTRLWKVCLQELADSLGFPISVRHFPPGTSKWNKIEHRMFCHITENWRGKPLTSRAVVVNLIGSTKTRKGLRIEAGLDLNNYEKGITVSDEELAAIHIRKSKFHGDWNYSIMPVTK